VGQRSERHRYTFAGPLLVVGSNALAASFGPEAHGFAPAQMARARFRTYRRAGFQPANAVREGYETASSVLRVELTEQT